MSRADTDAEAHMPMQPVTVEINAPPPIIEHDEVQEEEVHCIVSQICDPYRVTHHIAPLVLVTSNEKLRFSIRSIYLNTTYVYKSKGTT